MPNLDLLTHPVSLVPYAIVVSLALVICAVAIFSKEDFIKLTGILIFAVTLVASSLAYTYNTVDADRKWVEEVYIPWLDSLPVQEAPLIITPSGEKMIKLSDGELYILKSEDLESNVFSGNVDKVIYTDAPELELARIVDYPEGLDTSRHIQIMKVYLREGQ